MLKAIEAELESLANACTLATFGADNKDVMYLSYRRAGKMDVIDFLLRFNPERLGLSEFVRGHLLEGDERLERNENGIIQTQRLWSVPVSP